MAPVMAGWGGFGKSLNPSDLLEQNGDEAGAREILLLFPKERKMLT